MDYKRTLERAVRQLCNGADVVCDDMALHGGVPRLSYMTGGYSWDDEYVWNSWANFQWVGFLAGPFGFAMACVLQLSGFGIKGSRVKGGGYLTRRVGPG